MIQVVYRDFVFSRLTYHQISPFWDAKYSEESNFLFFLFWFSVQLATTFVHSRLCLIDLLAAILEIVYYMI